jgi:hypothetical protein
LRHLLYADAFVHCAN